MEPAVSNIEIYYFHEGYHTEEMFLKKSCIVEYPYVCIRKAWRYAYISIINLCLNLKCKFFKIGTLI
jgi:hypothetical protein